MSGIEQWHYGMHRIENTSEDSKLEKTSNYTTTLKNDAGRESTNYRWLGNECTEKPEL